MHILKNEKWQNLKEPQFRKHFLKEVFAFLEDDSDS